MKELKLFKKFMLVMLILGAISCSKDDDETNGEGDFTGSQQSIENIIGSDVYQSAQEMGFMFNTGSNPPIVEGSYIADNLEILGSTVGSDYVGMFMPTQNFTFSNQNIDDLSVLYVGAGGSQTDEGGGAFIAGEGGNFTALLTVAATIQGYTSQTVFLISGTIVAEGIENYQLAVFMIDQGEAPDGIFIPEGQGRVIHDTDDLAELQ